MTPKRAVPPTARILALTRYFVKLLLSAHETTVFRYARPVVTCQKPQRAFFGSAGVFTETVYVYVQHPRRSIAPMAGRRQGGQERRRKREAISSCAIAATSSRGRALGRNGGAPWAPDHGGEAILKKRATRNGHAACERKSPPEPSLLWLPGVPLPCDAPAPCDTPQALQGCA